MTRRSRTAIGECWIDDNLRPVAEGGDDWSRWRAAGLAVIDDFEQVAALLRGQRRQPQS